ncbi:MAG: S9 family peptidase [Bacteroidales bacterium]|nr:S9 family peptidase [Bacteroidales bacterium]
MKRSFLLCFALLLSAAALQAQKPALDHSVYDGWKSVGRPVIQNGGDWATYSVSPQEGDGVLYLYNVKSGKTYTIDRASRAVISSDATKAVYRITPPFLETRQAKIDKKKPDERPKGSIAVIDLKTGEIKEFKNVINFKSGDVLGDWIAFQEEEVKAPAPKGKKGEGKPEKGEKPEKPEKEKAPKDSAKADKPSVKTTVYVLNIKTLAVDTLKSVESYHFDRNGKRMAYVTKPEKKDSVTVRGLFVYDPATRESQAVLTGEKKASFGSFYFNEEGNRIAFYASLDTAKEAAKNQDLYLWEGGEPRMLLTHKASLLPKGWELGQKADVNFYDGYLTFGTRPVPPEKDTTLVDFEQAQLDIWVWNEDYIQTIQKNRLSRDKNRTYLAKIGYDGHGFVQLADEDMPSVTLADKHTCPYTLVANEKPYRIQRQWDYSSCSDLWQIDLRSGSRKLLEKASSLTYASESPDGAFLASYDEKERNWYVIDIAAGTKREVSSAIGNAFWDEEDDHPALPSAYAGAIWAEDGSYFWIRDRYDWWQIDPKGVKAPERKTFGRDSRLVYNVTMPYHRTDIRVPRGGILFTDRPVWFTTFDEVTKENGIARLDITRRKAKVENLAKGPYLYQGLAVSGGRKPVALYLRGNFEEGSDLWMTKDNFKKQEQLTHTGDQLKAYNWGTVELVKWTAWDGTPAEGLLFKPEDFNPARKYPMICYFYERNSETLYRPRVPAPSASTVNIPYFVSNGYLIFVPDLRYKDGHPGKSCMNFLMPGVDMLCENPWVDGDHIGIQGQSWGGYQTAYLITQTNRFAAAGAGAPVSNMTSAYGGIRWESGVARTAQYEKGQSRIGKDLWEGFDLYVENSPLFFVPNVTTPVLIMHNDQDGAVPWWQGIEFFNALRRCGKQAWMLQYNDEAHNLKERRNRKDLSVRLQQFFDHFLKGAPMPVWMSRGVPATLKGIDYGFGFDDNE